MMCDLETLGTKQNSAFISIGACQFNPDTGKIGEKFSVSIDWDSALDSRGVTGDTIKWWMRQDKAAQNTVCAGGCLLKPALKDFAQWFRKGTGTDERRIWGNGFDVGMLENAYEEHFGMTPWKFWNIRDVRTITDIIWDKFTKEDFPFQGTPHNALDDAIHQATYVSAMWQALKK